MDTLLPVISGLVGTLVGGALAYFNGSVQWKRQQAMSRNQQLSSKLEEACELVIDIQHGLDSAWAETMTRLNGLNYPDHLRNKERIPIEHLNMLVSLYFETLIPRLETIVQGRNNLGGYLAGSVTRPPSEGSERARLQNEAAAAHDQVKSACDEFLREASRLVKDFM